MCGISFSAGGFGSVLLTFDFAIGTSVLQNSTTVQTPRTEVAIWKACVRESSGQRKFLCLVTKFFVAPKLSGVGGEPLVEESVVVKIPSENQIANYFPPVVGGVVTLTGTATLTAAFCPPARMPSFAAIVVTNVFTIKFT